MILYDYQPAPSPRRVRIFLAEKGIEIPTVQIDLGTQQQFSEEFGALNPARVVPALKLDDGTVIGESVAICRYLEALHPDPPLFGTTPLEQAKIEMWQRHIEFDGLMHCRDAFRNKVAGMAGRALPGYAEGLEQIPQLVPRATGCIARFFATLDQQLNEHAYIAGDSYSIADIAGLVMTDFAKRLKIGPLEQQRSVSDWYERVSARPSAAA